MPMVRRSHDHRIHIGTRQNFSIVERRELSFRALLRQLLSLLVDITHGHDLDVAPLFGHPENQSHQARTAAADANDCHVETVIGALRLGRCLCRRGGSGEPSHGTGSDAAAYKISAIDSRSIWHLLSPVPAQYRCRHQPSHPPSYQQCDL